MLFNGTIKLSFSSIHAAVFLSAILKGLIGDTRWQHWSSFTLDMVPFVLVGGLYLCVDVRRLLCTVKRGKKNARLKGRISYMENGIWFNCPILLSCLSSSPSFAHLPWHKQLACWGGGIVVHETISHQQKPFTCYLKEHSTSCYPFCAHDLLRSWIKDPEWHSASLVVHLNIILNISDYLVWHVPSTVEV